MPISWADCGVGCFTTDFCVRAVIRNGDASASSTSQYEFSLGGPAGQYAWNKTSDMIDSGDIDVLLDAGQGGGTGNITLTLDTSAIDGDGSSYGDIVKVVLEGAVSPSAGTVRWTEIVATFYDSNGAGTPTDATTFEVPVRATNTYRQVAAAPSGSVRVRVQGKIKLVQTAANPLSLNALAGRIYVYTENCTHPS